MTSILTVELVLHALISVHYGLDWLIATGQIEQFPVYDHLAHTIPLGLALGYAGLGVHNFKQMRSATIR